MSQCPQYQYSTYFRDKGDKLQKHKKTVDKYAFNAYNINTEKGVVLTKRADLIRLLKKNGWYQIRDGGQHDIYTDGTHIEPIPRHREINENLAKAIIRRRGLK